MAACFGKEIAPPLSPVTTFSGCYEMMPKLASFAVTSEMFLVSSRILDRQTVARDIDFFTRLGRDRRKQPSLKFDILHA